MDHSIVAGIAGACAALILLTLTPHQNIQHWTSTQANANTIVGTAPISRVVPVTPFRAAQVPQRLTQGTQVLQASSESQAYSPMILGAAGLLAAIAVAVKLFKPTTVSPDYTILALSADAIRFREERERKERDAVAQRKREIQERMARLAQLGGGDGGHGGASGVKAAAVSPMRASSPSMYMDPAFQQETLAAFPAKANATAEEARVLWKLGGYSMLDVRSEMEGADGRIRGHNKGSIDIPLFNAKAIYDSNIGKKVVTQQANGQWLEEVKARFPDKNSKIIVMCSDGTKRSSQALDLLAAEGYRNIVLLRGGYNRWDQIFDRFQALRSPAQQAAKADWLDDDVEWGTWSASVGKRAPPTRTVAQSAAPATRTVRETISIGSYMDPAFQRATIAAFPATANATIEEARVLFKLDGYSIVDVRSEMEGADGRIRGNNKGSIDIPLFNAKSMYDSNLGKKVVTQEANPQWLDQMKARFPDKNSKIIVMCSDGTNRSSQALDLLAAEGYRNLVLMRGGFNRWDQVFDRTLALRSPAQQAAKAEWLDDSVEWGNWSASVGKRAPAQRAVPQSAAPASRTVRETVPLGNFNDAGFQSSTQSAFHTASHKALATVEEARVLWKGEFSILDIRSDLEGADGRIRGNNKGSVDIPLINAKSTYDSTLNRKVITQERNAKFLDQVKARFPKDSKIIIMCSDGTTRSSQAAQLLTSEGFKDLVVMEGGFRKWDQLFDNRLGVRTLAQQQSKAAELKDSIVWSRW